MFKQRQYGRFAVVIMMLFFSAQQAFAIDDWYKALPMLGSAGQIKVGSIISVQDDVFFNPSLKPTQTTYGVKNFVSLKLDESSRVLLPANFSIRVFFRLIATRADASGNPYIDSTSLPDGYPFVSVNYGDRTYDNKSVFPFDGAFKAVLRITRIDTMPGIPFSSYSSALVIENEMVVNRDFNFSCTNNSIRAVTTDASYVSNKGELRVSWPKDRAADEYDLEWTYIDKSALINTTTNSVPDPKKIFTNNATRVSITREDYFIPLLYDDTGTLYYRVRPVQIKNDGQRLEANWSSDWVNGLGKYVYNGGHEPLLNWQASTSFAEEGKRKSVIQYFDGSLRNRQTVTKDNTTDTTLVAETMYDYQGRPVIQVLPSPSLSAMIKYTPNFNKDVNNAEYDKKKYDDLLTATNYCGTGAPAMSVQAGASNYYSPNNPNKNNRFNQFIPDAKGYPFAETKYTQDNTGRISRQGGVGISHQIGKTDTVYFDSHETRYYYGSADPEDIDALFGSEAGNASHYFKNMVRDANGQYSVSYVDMHGRTVATALAGKPVARLDTLQSSRTITVTKKLIDSVNNIRKGTSIEASKGLIVTKGGNHTFNYALNADSIRLLNCLTPAANVCYDCLYNLTITISDDCNNQSLPGNKPYVFVDSNFTIGRIDTSCNAPKGFSRSFTINLKEGSYLVTKKLSISKYGMDYYRDSIFAVKNTCKTLSDFITEQRQKMPLIDCAPSCEKCSVATFRSWSLYRPYYMQQLEIADADTAFHRGQALAAFNNQLQACNEVCGTTVVANSIRRQMLADVSPPSGQYANVDAADEYSIFAPSTSNQPKRYRYSDLDTYNDETGKADTVFTSDGVAMLPKEMRPDDFISNFKNPWAESLIQLHPEYCKLKLYESDAFVASQQWDARFEKITTYQEAKDSGFLNPLGYTNVIAQPSSVIRDPFFNTAINPAYAGSWRGILNDSMRKKAPYTAGNFIDIWSFATIMAQCDTGTNACYLNYASNAKPFAIDPSCTGTLDIAWRYFQQLYKAEKTEIINKILAQACDGTVGIDVTKHTLNFADKAKLDAATPSTTEGGRAAITDLVNSSCVGYAKQWWKELGPCNYTRVDSINIMNRLIGVCQQGGDAEHPFGSSTVKPGNVSKYKSFDEAITTYNDSLRTAASPRNILSTSCNAFMISAPAAYDNRPVYSNQDIWTKPDSCQCTTVNALYGQYQSAAGGDASFSDYLRRTMGTAISNAALDSIRGLCDGTITCKALASPISLPPVLQCGIKDVCASCSLVGDTYAKFTAAFPGVVPIYNNTDSLQRTKNILFERFMNYQLGFSKQASDYLQFMEGCPKTSNTNTCDAALTDLLKSYANVRLDGISHFGDEDIPLNDLQQVVVNGVLGPTQAVKDAPTPFYLEQSFRPRGGRALCFKDSYAIEWRFKLPLQPAQDAVFFINIDGNIGGIFTMRKTAAVPGLYLGDFETDAPTEGCRRWGYYNAAPGTACYNFPGTTSSEILIAPGINALNEWMTIRIKVTTKKFILYCNGKNVIELPRSATTGLYWNFAQIAFNWAKYFSIDEIKILGDNDVPVYEEGFDNPLLPATVSGNFCPNFDCSGSFAAYFNQQRGTNYSYDQIAALYNSCGMPLNVCSNAGPFLCGRSAPLFPPVALRQYSPCDDSTNFIITAATMRYKAYKDSLNNDFNEKYLAKCLNAYKKESFTVVQPMSEFHYTLYYYDQAGNLVRTVPPEGVDMTVYGRKTYFDSVTIARKNGTVYKPKHRLKTDYRYNTLNQVTAQNTPDAGLSTFWYDRLGRLSISQNARQKAASTTEEKRQYSYTTYDYLGRINEVGQVNNLTTNGAMTSVISRNGNSLSRWLANLSTKREQVTRTFYDVSYPLNNTIPLNARNLRGRVSYTIITDDGNAAYYNAGTFYSYDVHGNVDTLLQDYGQSTNEATKNIMNRNANRWARMVYKYDLISGKVNQVSYNPKYYDVTTGNWVKPNGRFYHRYNYDAENRLTSVETSTDSVIWEKDARYEYYKHGPLARTILGDGLVQGLDYAYTIQGWLKGVNSASATSATDMGADGKLGGQNINIARDVLGYSLNYFDGDYAPINSSVNPFPDVSAPLNAKKSHRPLYNGNISSMVVNIKPLGTPYLYNYKYDQLNRLTGMDAFTGLDTVGNNWRGLTATKLFNERVSYDANGNIKRYDRYFDNPNVIMDSLRYNYAAGTNKLLSVSDASQGWVNGNKKIKNQSANNYSYDEIGNLTGDVSEYIPAGGIKWNVYGKITEINHSQPGVLFDTKKINYYYDASGNRIGKKVIKFGSSNVSYTWYVRDSQGNVMNVYTAAKDTIPADTALSNFNLVLSESHIYGSNRLAVLNRTTWAELFNSEGSPLTSQRGNKLFEISDHRANVMAVISDKKIGHTSNGTTLDYYKADVVSATDYFPFGMVSRSGYFGNLSLGYRYGFNGKENDNEVKGEGNQLDYGERIYDPRTGRFLSVDPLEPQYPMLTPYQFASNRPIDGIDQDGLEWKPVTGADGNLVDYTWAGFNANGSPVAGSVSGGVIIRDGQTYTYSSISSGNYQMGHLSIDDGSNVRMNANIFSGGTASYSFDEIDEDGGVSDVFASGTLGNATGASGAQISNALNRKYGQYVFDNTPHPVEAIETDGLGLFDWVGPGEAKALFSAAVGAVIRKEVAKAVVKKVVTKVEIAVARQAAVRKAWKEEQALVKATGQGTVRWSEKQTKQLLSKGKVDGYRGHHIKNVRDHQNIKKHVGNPDNIEFVTRKEHLQRHGGNFRNKTTGKLISRKLP